MIVRPPLSDLIESAIGQVGMQSIECHETHLPNSDPLVIREKLRLLMVAINAASPAVRAKKSVITSLTLILKSTEITDEPSFIVFLARKYPKIMMEVAEDPVIRNRINHLYLVMELNECFSLSSIKRLNRGIDGVKRKVFAIAQGQTETSLIDSADRIFDLPPEEVV